MTTRSRRHPRLTIAAGLATISLVWANPSSAQSILDDSGSRWQFLLGAGATFGGDRLATNVRADGRSESVRAGGVTQFFAGAQVRLAPSWHASLTGGYHYDSTGSYYGAVRFVRYPVELLTHYKPTRAWRFGGGIRAAIDPRLVGSGDAVFISETFENAISPVVEVEYLLTPQHGFKLRYVRERFRSESGGPTVRADHLGFMLTWYF